MIQKSNSFLNYKRKVKITKQAHAFKGFASSYHVEILNYSDPELQLKDTESAINLNLLSESKGFKFVTLVLVLVLLVESEDKIWHLLFQSRSNY